MLSLRGRSYCRATRGREAFRGKTMLRSVIGPMEALVYPYNFARADRVEEGSVEIEYDLDEARWPWLALPPRHPVLIEKYQYFGAVTVALAQSFVEPSTFTALTAFDWECPEDQDPDPATRGVFVDSSTPDRPSFEMILCNSTGEHVATGRGSGFVFRGMNIDAWRAQSKERVRDSRAARLLSEADPESAGLGSDGTSFLSPAYTERGIATADGLITTDRGFHPNHPFHTGSGDHVNAGHLFDCALQFAHLVTRSEEALVCTGGSARFRQFTELDVPFGVQQVTTGEGAGARTVRMTFSQLGTPTAELELRFGR